MEISTVEGIIRLCIALVLGGVIGYERQARHKAAGLRTHVLVCVGSCLCMIISINIAIEYSWLYGYGNSDPERIAAQVISGVGFLGAGTILANQKGRIVHGLTTAAGLWAVAALGLVVGAGYLVLAVVATILIFIVLTVFVRLDERVKLRHCLSCSIDVTMKNTVGQLRRLWESFERHHIAVESFRVLSAEEAQEARLRLSVSASGMDESEIIGVLVGIKGVLHAERSDRCEAQMEKQGIREE